MTRPTSDEDRRRAFARSRALARLAECFPATFHRLYQLELAATPPRPEPLRDEARS